MISPSDAVLVKQAEPEPTAGEDADSRPLIPATPTDFIGAIPSPDFRSTSTQTTVRLPLSAGLPPLPPPGDGGSGGEGPGQGVRPDSRSSSLARIDATSTHTSSAGFGGSLNSPSLAETPASEPYVTDRPAFHDDTTTTGILQNASSQTASPLSKPDSPMTGRMGPSKMTIGAGVGAGIGIIVIITLYLLFVRFRRRTRTRTRRGEEGGNSSDGEKGFGGKKRKSEGCKPAAPGFDELDGVEIVEIDGKERERGSVGRMPDGSACVELEGDNGYNLYRRDYSSKSRSTGEDTDTPLLLPKTDLNHRFSEGPTRGVTVGLESGIARDISGETPPQPADKPTTPPATNKIGLQNITSPLTPLDTGTISSKSAAAPPSAFDPIYAQQPEDPEMRPGVSDMRVDATPSESTILQSDPELEAVISLSQLSPSEIAVLVARQERIQAEKRHLQRLMEIEREEEEVRRILARNSGGGSGPS